MDNINTNGTVSLQDAMKMFTNIIRSLNATDQQIFLSFIAKEWRPEVTKTRSALWNRTDDDFNDRRNSQQDQLRCLKKIVFDIRERVPFDGILPSEIIQPPKAGENSDCDNKSTKHVDAFLYDDEEVEELIEQGKLENLYCSDCGSGNVKEYSIISHSTSVYTLLYIFHSVLPCLKGKTVLDIGSRLGAVLYGAHIITPAKRIIGVEMNKELCELQQDIIKQYKMDDRIEIVNKRIEECPDLVQISDIIIMNNPFEFYVPESVHTEIWKFLKANIRRGTILVTRPHMEITFKDLNTGISLNEWVKPYDSERNIKEYQAFGPLILDPEEYSDIQFYEVF